MANTFKEDGFRNIMKLNGFKKEGFYYRRDDGFEIDNTAGMYNLVYSDGTVIYCDSREKLIGELVLRNIVNRLFF